MNFAQCRDFEILGLGFGQIVSDINGIQISQLYVICLDQIDLLLSLFIS